MQGLADAVLVARARTRVALDVVGAHEHRARGVRGEHHLARRAGRVVGRREVPEPRVVDRAQDRVRGVAARGKHHAPLRADRDLFAVLGCEHSEHAPLLGAFADDVAHLGVEEELDAELIGLRLEHADVARALRLGREVGARIERAVDLDHLRLELHAEGLEPVQGGQAVFAERLHEDGVGAVVACGERLLHVQRHAVLDALPALAVRVRAVVVARAEKCVAAHKAQFFSDDDLRARLRCRNRGSQARSARADHHDIGRVVPFRRFFAGVGRSGGSLGRSERRGSGLQKVSAIECDGHGLLLKTLLKQQHPRALS